MLGEGVREHSGVGEAVVIRLAENDVVEHSDPEDLRRSCQPVGAFAVFPRWRRISGRMVMQEYDGSRALQDGGLEDFPWLCFVPSYVSSRQITRKTRTYCVQGRNIMQSIFSPAARRKAVGIER